MSVKENVKSLLDEIREIALRNNRADDEITVVAVSKTFPPEKIRQAFEAGIKNIGENYVQEFERKSSDLKGLDIVWHLVGHLQSNKVRKAVSMTDVIQSIDKISTLEKVNKVAEEIGKNQQIFIQVNTSGEESKFGVPPDKLLQFLKEALKFKNIKINGLMTIGPLTDDRKKIKDSFLQLKDLYYKVNNEIENLNMKYISMGMSDDYDIAIECGSNMLRIGRKIFGERSYI